MNCTKQTETNRVASSWRGIFDPLTIGFHWMTVVLVALLLATGFATGVAPNAATLDNLLVLHRSLGVSVWTITALRLAWRLTFAYLPPFPPHMSKPQQWTAKISEYLLYALLLVQPITGMTDTLFRGRPFMLFGWAIPALLPRSPTVFKPIHIVHAYGAEALLAVVGLHAAAALLHHFVLRDDVLQAMLPRRSRRQIKAGLDARVT